MTPRTRSRSLGSPTNGAVVRVVARSCACWVTSRRTGSRRQRRVDHAQRVRYFEIEQVEAIEQAAAVGRWRGEVLATYQRNPLPVGQEQEENEQLAELIRFAAYTGLRQGNRCAGAASGGIVVLRWSEINLRERTATVERALSGNTVGPPARDAAGAPVFTFHGLRHTVASLFIRKMDPVEVKGDHGACQHQNNGALPARATRVRSRRQGHRRAQPRFIQR